MSLLRAWSRRLCLGSTLFPCDNGHAQERSLFGALLKTVEAGDLWIEGRNLCTRDFLCDIGNRDAFFITRQHLGLKFEILEMLLDSSFRASD